MKKKPDHPNQAIAALLEFRREHIVSWAHVAKHCGISLRSLMAYKNGDSEPSELITLRIMRALGKPEAAK